MGRQKIIAGNWKMHKLPNEAINYIEELAPQVKNTNHEIILCVPYVDLFYSLLTVQGTNIKIGAQNMHYESQGAYTGEVSGEMLKSVGVTHVIIGHSERRQYFNETDETVSLKLKKAIECGLIPIFCVGETLEQRENGKTKEVILSQVKIGLSKLDYAQIESVVIAYEPIWAIGTGKTATAEDAQDSIKSIRDEISATYGTDIASKIAILYGGSVKPENANELFNMNDIDGGLVGGASLNVSDFLQIINYKCEDI